jgi:hypothetical protein
VDDRRKLLEAYAKQLKEGNPLAEDFVNTGKSFKSQAIQARDLAEDALANEFLKNTDLSVPGKGATRGQIEDFLNQSLNQVYPEFNGNPNLKLNKFLEGQHGAYLPDESRILIKDNPDLLKMLGTTFHEGAHKYDYDVNKFDGTDTFKMQNLKTDLPEGRIVKDLDPMQMSEIIHKGHHARIPNLRDADSFGLGALKSMLKSGKWKSVAAPVVGKGLATAAGGVYSVASEAADSEEEGSSSEQNALLRERDEQTRRDNNMQDASPIEKQTFQNMYNELDSGKAFDARRDALRKISGR